VDVRRQIEQACGGTDDERELRVAVLAELRRSVPFDAHVWLLTDPASCVGWSPVAEAPDLADLPDLILAKYLTAPGRWTTLPAGVTTTLAELGDGDLSRSPLARFVRSRYAITDIASVALHDHAGCWGFLDLWRRDAPFDAAERAALAATATIVTPALRRALLSTFESSGTAPVDGPAVLLLGEDLRPVAQTVASTRYLEALLPPGPQRAVVPAAALNVAAQLRAVEAGVDDHAPEARIYVPDRSWMTIRAGRIDDPSGSGPTITVTLEPARPVERSKMYGAVAGLSRREATVLDAVAAGHDTRRTAQRLGISEHTVQDHLKAVFAKTGADSRRQLIARATGTAD
jgi:DNA-binding CsgD family transcriptional regulator